MLKIAARNSTRRALSARAFTVATATKAIQLGAMTALARYGMKAKEPRAALGTTSASVSATTARNDRSNSARSDSELTPGDARKRATPLVSASAQIRMTYDVTL